MKVKCPQCHGVLEVSNPSNAPTLLIACPQCKAKMRLRFATGETVLAQEDVVEEQGNGWLSYAGDRYELKEGVNTIGRKSVNSNASIQIDTDDVAMSRDHAEINVVVLKNGRTKAILQDLRDEEKMELLPTTVDDEPLLMEDRIVLAHGDVITLGKTKLKYQRR